MTTFQILSFCLQVHPFDQVMHIKFPRSEYIKVLFNRSNLEWVLFSSLHTHTQREESVFTAPCFFVVFSRARLSVRSRTERDPCIQRAVGLCLVVRTGILGSLGHAHKINIQK